MDAPILGCRIALHGLSDDLNIAAAPAQDIAQRPFQIVHTNWIGGLWLLEAVIADVLRVAVDPRAQALERSVLFQNPL